MTAHPRRRALLGVAAGATVTALFAASLAVPAGAAPSPTTKLKLADAANQSRVVKDRYLVETVGTPLALGGSKVVAQAGIGAAKASAKVAGATVDRSYSKLWTGVSVTATDAQIAQLARSSAVKAIYPVLSVPMPKTTVSKTRISNEIAAVSATDTGFDGTGIKVGIIDTGIDYTNPDLGGPGTFPTSRVAFGTDLVGDNYDSSGETAGSSDTPAPDNDPMDCAGHGTHVAGIVGADGDPDTGGAVGVATNVTFGAYKVFGCEGSTDTEVIIEAMEKALTDGMDIVNMSLGSDFDSWPSYPDAVAASGLTKAGVVVVAAAGNSGDTGLFSAGTPAVGSSVISVASYESAKVRTRVIATGGSKIAYTSIEDTAAPPADNASQLTLRLASNTTACTQPAAVPAGTALLVKRGSCTFHDKVANAAAAGAEAVVIYNNVPGLDSFTAAGTNAPFAVYGIAISGKDGDALAAKLLASGPQSMTWMDYQQDVPNPDGSALSTFSSAGLAADLSLVPTITAPGGKIYSTLPMAQGGHGNLSGTSMASPFIAGAAALLLDADGTLSPAKVAQKLYNTATPVTTATEKKASGASLAAYPEAVFRQGSGLVNVAGALSAGVTASPSTIKLGEGTSHKVKITLTNKTSGTLTYTPYRVSGVSAAASTNAADPSVGTTTPLYDYGSVWFKSYKKSITVKAGKSASIYVRIKAPMSVLKGKAGLLYGGWVQFKTSGAGNTVSIPFAGVRGNYQSVKVLNKFQPVIDAQGNTWKLPALGYLDGDGYPNPQYAAGRTYTLTGTDFPVMLYHLDYPASDVQIKLTNKTLKMSFWATLDYSTWDPVTNKISSSSTHTYRQSRDDSFQGFVLDGMYYKGIAYNLPDGTYTAQLRVLKPLGNAKKTSDWETFTTPTFNVEAVG